MSTETSNLNEIQPTGTWASQVADLNGNFNKLLVKANTAISTADAAREAISSLEGLADATTAEETLATLVTQIQTNTSNIETLDDEQGEQDAAIQTLADNAIRVGDVIYNINSIL